MTLNSGNLKLKSRSPTTTSTTAISAGKLQAKDIMTAGDGGVRREDTAGGTVVVLFLGMWLERPDVY